jgi:hypothetical protein
LKFKNELISNCFIPTTMSSNKARYSRPVKARPMKAEPINPIELIEIYIDEDGEEIETTSPNQNRLS